MGNPHPRLLTAKVSAVNKLSWYQATNGTFAHEFQNAMKLEIDTLISLGAWVRAAQESLIHIINMIWALKVKRFSNGLMIKLNA